MDFQLIIVGLIILAACIYAGKTIIGKVKSFSSKSSCSSDCGCETTAKPKKLFTQIKRS